MNGIPGQGVTPPRSRDKDRRAPSELKYQTQKLRSQVAHLRRYISTREKEHQFQISQLVKENKHFSHQIMKLQDELMESRKKGKKAERQECLLMELKQYINNAGNEIRKREQREIVLLEENQGLKGVVERVRKEVERGEKEKKGLEEKLEGMGGEIRGYKERLKEMEERVQELNRKVVDPPVDAPKRDGNGELEEEIVKLKKRNQELSKDCECLLDLLGEKE